MSRTRRAPAAIWLTIPAVPALEPSLTTMISYLPRPSGAAMAFRVRAMFSASLYAITTKLTKTLSSTPAPSVCPVSADYSWPRSAAQEGPRDVVHTVLYGAYPDCSSPYRECGERVAGGVVSGSQATTSH